MRTDVTSSLKKITPRYAAAKPQKFFALTAGFIKASLPKISSFSSVENGGEQQSR